MANTFTCICNHSKSPRKRTVLITCQCGRVWRKVKYGYNQYRWKQLKNSAVEEMLLERGHSVQSIQER